MSATSERQGEPPILDQLRPLFFPHSIAVVGASQELWKPGSAMIRALQSHGFPGSLYAVGRGGGRVLGLDVHQSLGALPEPVDLAFLFVPAKALPGAVRECRERGVRAVVAFAAGFGETGTDEGRALDAALAAECDGSFRMIGPNCLGLYCPAGGITQHCGREYPAESGEVAFIAQSGGLTEDFVHAIRNRGFFASKVVSYGNAMDVNEADLLEYLSEDPETQIIGMYIEGPRDGRRLFRALRHAAARKPVVVWRGGLTPTGMQAAGSHTGSLAGSLEVWEAMLTQAGVVRMTTLEEMLDTLQAFHFLGAYDDPRVGFVCSGGGFGVAASDAAYRAGLTLPVLSAQTQSRLTPFLLPAGTNPANPVDVFVPFPSAASLKGVLETVAGSGEVGAVVIDRIAMSSELRRLMNMSELLEKEDEPWLDELPIRIKQDHGVAVMVVLREDGDPSGRAEFDVERLRLRHYYQSHGVPVYPTGERAVRALGQVTGFNRRRAARAAETEVGSRPSVQVETTSRGPALLERHAAGAPLPPRQQALMVVEASLRRGRQNLSEHESKQVLAAYGIPVTNESVVASQEELAVVLHNLRYPVVLKIDSPDILHKTEAGLVELGCANAEEARAAFRRITMRAAERFPEAFVNGVLVYEMVPAGVECIVGMKVDPHFGPAVMFGLGGIFVEVIADVALGVAPLTRAEAAALVRSTKAYTVLAGARGQTRADVQAIEDILVNLSTLALDLEPHVAEIDINPVLALPEGSGAVAVDALVVLNGSPGRSRL